MSDLIMPARKHIALVAHDHKKAELLAWAQRNQAQLAQHQLYATGTTGKLLANQLQLPVHCFASGPLGGDLQIGAHITTQQLHMLIFFWDPLAAQPHDPDVRALLRVAVVWNIPVACNTASADFLFSSPILNQVYKRNIPDYQNYLERALP
jgi:methylglyoxal synthase